MPVIPTIETLGDKPDYCVGEAEDKIKYRDKKADEELKQPDQKPKHHVEKICDDVHTRILSYLLLRDLVDDARTKVAKTRNMPLLLHRWGN